MVTSDSLSDSTKYKVPSLPFYDISLSISLTKAPLSNISLVDTVYFFLQFLFQHSFKIKIRINCRLLSMSILTNKYYYSVFLA